MKNQAQIAVLAQNFTCSDSILNFPPIKAVQIWVCICLVYCTWGSTANSHCTISSLKRFYDPSRRTTSRSRESMEDDSDEVNIKNQAQVSIVIFTPRHMLRVANSSHIHSNNSSARMVWHSLSKLCLMQLLPTPWYTIRLFLLIWNFNWKIKWSPTGWDKML